MEILTVVEWSTDGGLWIFDMYELGWYAQELSTCAIFASKISHLVILAHTYIQ